MNIFLSAFIIFPSLVTSFNPVTPKFEDVTSKSGLKSPNPKLKKYGGPTVADLNNDGLPDLLFCHHDSSWAEIYFNEGEGKFSKYGFQVWTDMHGIVVSPYSVYKEERRFTISSGGNYGLEPVSPLMYQVKGRKIEEISKRLGTDKHGGRGRTAVFMDLKMGKDKRYPDVLFTNAKPKDKTKISHFAYSNSEGSYNYMRLKTYEYNWNWYAMPADVDGDGQMELISYQNFTIHKLVAPFTFKDITDDLIPSHVPRVGTIAIAEFDFDNDGNMDLYVSRTNTGDLRWLPGKQWPDLLLKKTSNGFTEVGKIAKIPQNSESRGVTVADFNNDGYLDIFVPQYREADIMLLNQGDGTFKTIQGLVKRPPHVRGDHAVAVDYDLDGRVDLVVGQGDQEDIKLGGSFRLLRNVLPRSGNRRFLLVKVGSAPDKSATSLHAVVTIKAQGRTQKRRVGSPGDAVSRSFLETLHFGLGDTKMVQEVRVEWISGTLQYKRNVQPDSTIQLGI